MKKKKKKTKKNFSKYKTKLKKSPTRKHKPHNLL